MILGEKIPKKQKVSVLNDAAGAIEEKFNEIQNGLDAIGEAMKPFLEVRDVPYVSISVFDVNIEPWIKAPDWTFSIWVKYQNFVVQ